MTDTYWQWMTGLALCLVLILIPVVGYRLYLRTRPSPEPDVATEAASEPTAATDDGFAAWFCERSQATGMDYTRDQAYRMYQAWCNRSSVEIAQGGQAS